MASHVGNTNNVKCFPLGSEAHIAQDIYFLALDQRIVPVFWLKCIRTLDTALGKGMFTLFHGSPAILPAETHGSQPANHLLLHGNVRGRVKETATTVTLPVASKGTELFYG